MKYAAAALFCSLLFGASLAGAGQCINADPSLELDAVTATDVELLVDPRDSRHIIYTSPLADGPSNIVVARIDSQSGKVISGSLTTVANNFNGESFINGAEFVQKPTGEVGLVYTGNGGVHGVFRPATQGKWNDFKFDINGAAVLGGSPPLLPNTSDGSYPKGGLPLGQNTYTHKLGNCTSACYGAMNHGISTDIAVVAGAAGYTVYDSIQSPRDGYVFFRACKAADNCGLYEALIDNAGGLAQGSFLKVASVPDGPIGSNRLAAARHPVTGSTIAFSVGENKNGLTVDVWEQAAAGGEFVLLDKVGVSRATHFRAITSATDVVLHYRIRDNVDRGSYTISVRVKDRKLDVGRNKRISLISGGSELIWSPITDRWALYYRKPPQPLTACAVNP